MDSNTKLWFLENFNIMETLSDPEKMAMSKLMTDREFSRNEAIMFPGVSSKNIYFLKKGKVKISTISDDGREMIVAILGPGEVFGELAVTGIEEKDEVAVATEDAMICALDIKHLQNMMETNPKLNLQITKLIGLKLKKIKSRLESLCFKTAPERIKQFIADMVNDYGREIGFEKEVKLNLTHQDIANLTATTRQTVTLVMRDLEKKDIILYDRKRILVRNMEALQ